MPKPRPLTPGQAKRSLAHRFGPLADKLRQLETKFGLRPMRVFLVWVRWTGEERGAGEARVVLERELLPTPKVDSLDAVTYSLGGSAGAVPMGSVKVTEVSSQLTFDFLRGVHVVTQDEHVPQPYEFFYELMEDGRGDPDPVRLRFRLLSTPFRRAGRLDWTLMLERASEDRSRAGNMQPGNDEDR